MDNSMELLMRHSSPLDLITTTPVTTASTTAIGGDVGNRSNVLFVSSTSGGRSSSSSNNNSSPSPLRLNRPRSNPRNRTPNRATIEEEGKEQEELVERRVMQRQQVVSNSNDNNTRQRSMEGRRITIRPMAGAAVGTNMAGTRVSSEERFCCSKRENGSTRCWIIAWCATSLHDIGVSHRILP
jgi:hypothetical protein